MPRISQRELSRRFQRAITGYQIEVMSIPALWKELERAAVLGADDERLRAIAQTYACGEG